MMDHTLDNHPFPEEQALFINEPWLVDLSLLNDEELSKEPELQKDNIRVYVPVDLTQTRYCAGFMILLENMVPLVKRMR